MARPKRQTGDLDFDPELATLPAEVRWREWMNRIEAVLFAAPQPVDRIALSRVIGREASIDLLIADIRADLKGKAYDIVNVAGGWQMRTRPSYAGAIEAAAALPVHRLELSASESVVLASIAYNQPITRSGVGAILGREISRDVIGALRDKNMITAGPRSPTAGAPFTYVTTKAFLSHFGLNTLRDLPDIEALEDAGLLDRSESAAQSAEIEEGEHDDHDADTFAP